MPCMEPHRLALTPGYQIEHFRIEATLGKGGFGITYVALDLQLGKRVAIKELLPDSIATRVDGSTVVPHSASMQENWEWARERFLDEARILAGFSHPAIVGVHRLIEANGTVYMVMDYVEGESYQARLRRAGCEPDQASLMAVVGPILDGLSEVHAKGLLHRDIKPDNILISRRGHPILIDFGSARSSIGATMTMTSIVTHGYSPIEQYQTKGKMGPWTDIYALGAVMCRAITGKRPPVAADRMMNDDFQWVSYLEVPGYSKHFLQAVDWTMRLPTQERPQSVVDFHRALSRIETSNPRPTRENTNQAPPDFFKVSCPHCTQHIRIPLDMHGQEIECPTCSSRFRARNGNQLDAFPNPNNTQNVGGFTQSISPSVPQIRPWSRAFARGSDMLLVNILIGFVFGSFLSSEVIEVMVSTPVVACLLFLFIEPAWLSRHATTPGKWMFNIKVVDSSHRKLSYQQALRRSFHLWYAGQGAGLPLVNLITNLISYFRLKNKGVTFWDEKVETRVCHEKFIPWKIALFIGIWLVIIFYAAKESGA
jgi:serine/threonine protein kinase